MFLFRKPTAGSDPQSFDEVANQEIAEIQTARHNRKIERSRGAAASAGAGPSDANAVASAESGELAAQRAQRTGSYLAALEDGVGVAFSGGGIRSATFNLGFLQGLASQGFLKQIDYLSTVSGGGYIGSWLTSWIWRSCKGGEDGCRAVEDTLRNVNANTGHWRFLEPEPLRFLRRYSNYLAPRTGLVSGDTWALIGIYVRNVLLNLIVLAALGFALMEFPLFLLKGAVTAYRGDIFTSNIAENAWSALAVPAAIVLLLLAAVSITRSLEAFDHPDKLDVTASTVAGNPGRMIILPVVLASMVLAIRIAMPGPGVPPNSASWSYSLHFLDSLYWVPLIAVVYVFVTSVADIVTFLLDGATGLKPIEPSLFWEFIARICAGLTAGLCLVALRRIALSAMHAQPVGDFHRYAGAVIVWGPPLAISAYLIIAMVHIGIMGIAFPDGKREWFGRLNGTLGLIALLWFFAIGIAVYGHIFIGFLFASPWARSYWGRAISTVLTGGWLGTTLAGLIGANRSPTKPGSPGSSSSLLKLAPPVFVVGLALLLASSVHWALAAGVHAKFANLPPSAEAVLAQARAAGQSGTAGEFAQRFSSLMKSVAAPDSLSASWNATELYHWRQVGQFLQYFSPSVPAFLGVLALYVLLGYRLDVNEFSIHLLYRNRLVRCYLGATRKPNERKPQPYTGFDLKDDVPLANLRSVPPPPPDQPLRLFQKYAGMFGSRQAIKRSQTDEPPQKPYNGPYPIICSALNLVDVKDLAWQKRRATSFIYSPLFCGFDHPPGPAKQTPSRLRDAAFRKTEEFSGPGGPYLGTAVAISGAAASPNMGYHSSPAITFLMGVFDVRLGWWAGNPRCDDTYPTSGPKTPTYLLNELFGRTTDSSPYVYLSDGGHFENLGLYELVRRHCRFIVVSDADCDPKMAFQDLGNAIEKCRCDFGASIDIDVSRLKLGTDGRHTTSHYAVGTIHYADRSVPDGTLLYVKTSLTGDEPADVQAYAAEHPSFPHDSTAEQFFNETQFEAYRALGQHVCDALVRELSITLCVRMKAAIKSLDDEARAALKLVAFDDWVSEESDPPRRRLQDLISLLWAKSQLQEFVQHEHSAEWPATPGGKLTFTYRGPA